MALVSKSKVVGQVGQYRYRGLSGFDPDKLLKPENTHPKHKHKHVVVVVRLGMVVMLLAAILISSLCPTMTMNASASTDPNPNPNPDTRYFPETRHNLSGKFLTYWNTNGGLSVFGYPITEARNETDPETGKAFLTQWFERNRFELHPENSGTKYEVLLGLLGKDLRRQALTVDPDFRAITAATTKTGFSYFKQTGHSVSETFLTYWNTNGGLERFGYPLDEQHEEVDPQTGRVFLMQWFERARFELHTENRAPYNVLLGLLGNQLQLPRVSSSSPQFSWKIGSTGVNSDLGEPTGIAVDRSRQLLYVAVLQATPASSQPGNSTIGQQVFIKKYDTQGHFLSSWIVPTKSEPVFLYLGGLAVDSQGSVYLASAGTQQLIQKFDANGRLLTSWGSPGTGNGQFNNPTGLAIDKGDNVFVVDQLNGRIQKFDSSGRFLSKIEGLTLIGTPRGDSNSSLYGPNGIAIDNQNNLYVTDSAANGVVKLDAAGHVLARWGSPSTSSSSQPGQFSNPVGIATDSQNNVYVSDVFNHRVEKFDSAGKFLSEWGVEGQADGTFSLLDGYNGVGLQFGLAIDQEDNIFVSDTKNTRVQKFH